MSKEQPENIFKNMPNRLTEKEIGELMKKYPGVKLDEGSQHFVIEQKNEQGEIIRSVFIPTWEKIPKEEGEYFNTEEKKS
ncbi:MAG: hypothetical protein HYW34_02535 [Candidatus Brennerbacteria bacterium]|nr:hypothetical protein [Candidatus Brennerbacteria bacterium]